jgi:type II secretory ATPase GspE/PulE/Tfp pilus assembly ATPase PilB-like protein
MGFFSRFFKKKPPAAPAVTEASAPVEATKVSSSQASGPVFGRTDRAPRIREYAELPPYDSVLTADGELLPLPETQQKGLALLHSAETGGILVATDRFFGSSQHMTLVARAERAFVKVVTNVIADDSAILALIYEKARRNLSNKQDESVSKAESIQLFESIVTDAVLRRATDIHIFLREETSSVVFRVDSHLRKYREYPSYMLNEATGVAFTKLAEESSRSHPSYNSRFPQSCSVVLTGIAGRALNLRYQSVPAVGGADIVLRLLFTDDGKKESPSLEMLGYAESHQKLLKLAARKTVGTIILAGVTGSGKSTTLKTLMTMNPDRHLWKQYSVEDPAEYVLPGITQVSVQRKAEAVAEGVSSNPFVAAMRIIMRADPDEIMVGEVRDAEGGSLLKSMVQSGHQVYTTVHAVSAIEVVERMTSDEIGISRQTMASRSFISALVYQRLLAKNCEACRLPADGNLPEEYLSFIERKFALSRRTMTVACSHGCPSCDGTGVLGQTVVAEIIAPDSAILKLIREGRDIEAEELWRSRRTAAFDDPNCDGKTAFEHGLYKVSQGVIDPRTLEDAFEPFESYQLYKPKEAA